MQSFHSLVCQIFPLPVVLDAIQQDEVEFPCPGGTLLCAVFRTHVEPSTAIPPGLPTRIPHSGRKKAAIQIRIRKGQVCRSDWTFSELEEKCSSITFTSQRLTVAICGKKALPRVTDALRTSRRTDPEVARTVERAIVGP